MLPDENLPGVKTEEFKELETRKSPLARSSLSWRFLASLFARWQQLPFVSAVLLLALTILCVIAITNPSFTGAIGIKISPNGIEFNMDKR
jgi:hypothetical protein